MFCTLFSGRLCCEVGEEKSAKCSFVIFPNHHKKHLRQKCGNELMKDVLSPNGKKVLIPFKTYCYRSLKQSLQQLIEKSGFEEDCEKWRKLEKDPELLAYIYDGKIWNSFHSNDTWYFSKDNNYAVMLNVDWFQPFKHASSYSIDGIYLVILNLLRNTHFQRKNVTLVGIIPNMQKGPPTNTFMKPLVDELIQT